MEQDCGAKILSDWRVFKDFGKVARRNVGTLSAVVQSCLLGLAKGQTRAPDRDLNIYLANTSHIYKVTCHDLNHRQ